MQIYVCLFKHIYSILKHFFFNSWTFPNCGFPDCVSFIRNLLEFKDTCIFSFFLFLLNGTSRQRWGGTIETQSEFVFAYHLPSASIWFCTVQHCEGVHWNESLHAIVPVLCLWCYLGPTRGIICGVSVPHSVRPQWGYFSQPSIQTWPITARLQKHFPCTQELTAVNGGYFQSLCCQSKCQINTGRRKQL